MIYFAAKPLICFEIQLISTYNISVEGNKKYATKERLDNLQKLVQNGKEILKIEAHC